MKIELAKSDVRYIDKTHQYFLGDKELCGITSTLVKRAFPDDYKCPPNFTEEEWKAILENAANKGKNVHEIIELYEEMSVTSTRDELNNYIRIKSSHGLIHLASEYLVSDNERYATMIDHVFTDINGEIIITDIKTTADKHYDKTALQLSINKRFFELQNPTLKVGRIAQIWLRDDKYEYRVLTPWTDEAIDELIAADCSGENFDIIKTYGDLPELFMKVEDEIERYVLMEKKAKEEKERLQKGLYDAMEKYNVLKWSGSKVKLARVLPTEAKTFDSKKFAEEHPDLFEEYQKTTRKNGYLKITLSK